MSGYQKALAAMLREWDRQDARAQAPAPKGNGRG